MGNEMSD